MFNISSHQRNASSNHCTIHNLDVSLVLDIYRYVTTETCMYFWWGCLRELSRIKTLVLKCHRVKWLCSLQQAEADMSEDHVIPSRERSRTWPFE